MQNGFSFPKIFELLSGIRKLYAITDSFSIAIVPRQAVFLCSNAYAVEKRSIL